MLDKEEFKKVVEDILSKRHTPRRQMVIWMSEANMKKFDELFTEEVNKMFKDGK